MTARTIDPRNTYCGGRNTVLIRENFVCVNCGQRTTRVCDSGITLCGFCRKCLDRYRDFLEAHFNYGSLMYIFDHQYCEVFQQWVAEKRGLI
jgi:hypothetical protein